MQTYNQALYWQKIFGCLLLHGYPNNYDGLFQTSLMSMLLNLNKPLMQQAFMACYLNAYFLWHTSNLWKLKEMLIRLTLVI